MKLNLGCGAKKRPGWVNVDHSPVTAPDMVCDLEHFPWPWEDDSVGEIELRHVLEHLGQTTAVYLNIIREIYRICRHGTHVRIVVPHPRHDDFINDPTHVRPITYESLKLFDLNFNARCIEQNWANSLLGMQLGVDLAIESYKVTLDPIWQGRYDRGEVTTDQVNRAMREQNNVVRETDFWLAVRKQPKVESVSAQGGVHERNG
jgi:hypothetical protein